MQTRGPRIVYDAQENTFIFIECCEGGGRTCIRYDARQYFLIVRLFFQIEYPLAIYLPQILPGLLHNGFDICRYLLAVVAIH